MNPLLPLMLSFIHRVTGSCYRFCFHRPLEKLSPLWETAVSASAYGACFPHCGQLFVLGKQNSPLKPRSPYFTHEGAYPYCGKRPFRPTPLACVFHIVGKVLA